MPYLPILSYAAYVIGKVESEWNWTSTGEDVPNDAITVGMFQDWGFNAAGLFEFMKKNSPVDYALLPDSIKNDLDVHGSSNWWNHRYLSSSEHAGVKVALKSKTARACQIAWFERTASRYYTYLRDNWNITDSKAMVFAMCMYHQSPQACIQVLSSCSDVNSLARLYAVCMRNGIIGKYTNRYNTALALLEAWDGVSMAPDFGSCFNVTLDGKTNISSFAFKYLQLRSDILIAYGAGSDTTISFIPSASDCWQAQGVLHDCVALAQGSCIYLYAQDYAVKRLQFIPCGVDTWVCSMLLGSLNDELDGVTQAGNYSGSGTAGAIVKQMFDWQGKFRYGQGAGRLDIENSGHSDCSGTIWCAYRKVCGVDCGSWTGEMVHKGRLVYEGYATKENPFPYWYTQPADLVLLGHTWGMVTHVELACGGNALIGTNHTPCPSYKDNAQNTVYWWGYYMIRRIL